ncbi:DNA-packaging protein [Escherichia coli]|nr:DNA-packaging protein [Escherichia coli]
MEVNKKQLADIFGASIRTIQNWQEQGMPVLRGGGKGNEVLYDSAAVIKWYAERDAEIENEKLRREVEELRQASETDLQPGTIEYERHRLTRAQADAQELKNARDSAEVVETAFCTFVLSRIAGEIASILDGIPLSVQRRFPELENRHVDFLKRDIIKAMNKAAALLGNTQARGLRTYGCIQDADAQREGINASARYPKNWVTTGDPAREFTMIQSAPLMLLADPDAFVSVQLA